MIAVFWSYSKDSKAIPVAVSALRRAIPNCKAVILNDANDPVSFSGIMEAAPDFVWTTNHKRPGRLAGMEHCKEASRIYAELCEHTGENGILKLDSDFAALNFDWMDTGLHFHAFRRPQSPLPHGQSFWISREASEKILDFDPGEFYGNEAFVESMALWSWAHELFPTGVRLKPWQSSGRRIVGFHYNVDPEEEMNRIISEKEAAGIAFGNLNEVPGCRTEGREMRDLRMWQWEKAMDSNRH